MTHRFRGNWKLAATPKEMPLLSLTHSYTHTTHIHTGHWRKKKVSAQAVRADGKTAKLKGTAPGVHFISIQSPAPPRRIAPCIMRPCSGSSFSLPSKKTIVLPVCATGKQNFPRWWTFTLLSSRWHQRMTSKIAFEGCSFLYESWEARGASDHAKLRDTKRGRLGFALWIALQRKNIWK